MERLNTEHGIFTNNELTGKTAQEVYQGWLEERDNPKPTPPTIEYRVTNTEIDVIALEETIDVIFGGV